MFAKVYPCNLPCLQDKFIVYNLKRVECLFLTITLVHTWFVCISLLNDFQIEININIIFNLIL